MKFHLLNLLLFIHHLLLILNVNKRDGVFPEIKTNPIEDKKFDAESWLCYPAKVEICYVLFTLNVKFMAQGVTLCNLFDLADESEYRNRKPDLIYVYGYEDGEMNQAFYQDESNDMIVALLSASDDFDYFGYMKKMCLTLHNVQKLFIVNYQSMELWLK